MSSSLKPVISLPSTDQSPNLLKFIAQQQEQITHRLVDVIEYADL
ncbi:hypothetical protein [Endozoicomonas sp. ALD040]